LLLEGVLLEGVLLEGVLVGGGRGCCCAERPARGFWSWPRC